MRPPLSAWRMADRKMKMQAPDKKTPLRLVCKTHRIETWRAKLARLGLDENFETPGRVSGPRCATCIFILQRGPQSTLYAEIYSELCLGARYGVQRLGRSLKINIVFVLRCSAVLQQHVKSNLTATTSPSEGVRCDGWAQHHSETQS